MRNKATPSGLDVFPSVDQLHKFISTDSVSNNFDLTQCLKTVCHCRPLSYSNNSILQQQFSFVVMSCKVLFSICIYGLQANTHLTTFSEIIVL